MDTEAPGDLGSATDPASGLALKRALTWWAPAMVAPLVKAYQRLTLRSLLPLRPAERLADQREARGLEMALADSLVTRLRPFLSSSS